jgi:hypothetical protein
MAAAILPAFLHRSDPEPVLPFYAFHFVPQLLQIQNDSEWICFPFVQKPHRIPTGPARSHPQHPLLAEKSLPSVVVSVITWQLSLPHFGHCIISTLSKYKYQIQDVFDCRTVK